MASAPLAHLRAQCEAEIASHREEEAAVLAEIGAALDGAKAADESTRLGLERGWSDALIETAVALARQVEDGRHVAERVSSGVRKLDSARQHAQSAIEIAESLASLRELATRAALSMTRGDLRAAAECVQDFHKMELIAGVMEGDDYVALTSAEAALREVSARRAPPPPPPQRPSPPLPLPHRTLSASPPLPRH